MESFKLHRAYKELQDSICNIKFVGLESPLSKISESINSLDGNTGIVFEDTAVPAQCTINVCNKS